MDRKGAWVIAASIVLGFTILGLSPLLTEGRRSGQPGRYQTIGIVAEPKQPFESAPTMFILDTTTGDIYFNIKESSGIRDHVQVLRKIRKTDASSP